tara:strand:+ start:43 stop:381 length:339 start_codon:yes stop_codon:yes gene_type:complete
MHWFNILKLKPRNPNDGGIVGKVYRDKDTKKQYTLKYSTHETKPAFDAYGREGSKTTFYWILVGEHPYQPNQKRKKSRETGETIKIEQNEFHNSEQYEMIGDEEGPFEGYWI